MKVSVKNIPVRYNGKRYEKGESFDMNEKFFDEKLVEKVASAPKKPTKDESDAE